MKAITLGYKDRDAKGPAVVIASPEVPISEQRQEIHRIKSTRDYPKGGIVRVEYCELEVREIGILIEPETETKPKSKKEK